MCCINHCYLLVCFETLHDQVSFAQVAPAVQLRRVKQEVGDTSQSSQQQAGAQAKKGVSALKGFWETQSNAKSSSR